MADRSEKPGPGAPAKYGGAYSYANAFGPSSYDDDDEYRPRSRLRAFCCCFLSTLLAIIVVLGVAALVLYLIFRPRIPRYTIEDVKIQKLNVTSSNRVDSDISFLLRANNPNGRIGIRYKSISTSLWYRGAEIGKGSIPAFYQGTRNVTLLRSVIHGSKVPVSNSAASSLKSSLGSSSNIPLESVTKVKARIRVGKLTLPPLWVRIKCSLRLTPPSAQGGARLVRKDCKVSRWR